MKPLLQSPEHGEWNGPEAALTALYKWRMNYDPAQESYSLRAKEWRYIRYENGREELYLTTEDPHEWTNLADNPKHQKTLQKFRKQLKSRIPNSGSPIPPQPDFKPKKVAAVKPVAKPDAEAWKNQYFSKHPAADTNQDGTLTWSEYKAYREKFDPPAKPNRSTTKK